MRGSQYQFSNSIIALVAEFSMCTPSQITQIQAFTYKHAYINNYAKTHIHTYMNTHIHANTRSYMYTFIHIFIHTRF